MIFRRMPGRTVFALRLHFHHDLVLAHDLHYFSDIATGLMKKVKFLPEEFDCIDELHQC